MLKLNKKQKKIVWWILGIIGFIILLNLIGIDFSNLFTITQQPSTFSGGGGLG